jgi:hypothetical protein
MAPGRAAPPFVDRFLATADAVARARPDVDRRTVRDVFLEAATLLHDGLALDGLDAHDADVVVDALCVDLVAEDPGAALRARSRAAVHDAGELHDPGGVAAAYVTAASVLQL